MTMTAVVQDRTAPGAARVASGIAIDPLRLTRLRDLAALSREQLAEKIGEQLFDRDAFAEVLSGRRRPMPGWRGCCGWRWTASRVTCSRAAAWCRPG